MCEEKRGCPHCPRVPVNSLQSAKGSEEITPHGREVIFAMSKGTSRHPSQDYKNFGTRFRGSCTKFHRILQQCAPLFFGLCFLSIFSFFYYPLFDIAGFSTEVHPYFKELSVHPKQREARNACHESVAKPPRPCRPA